MKILLILLPLFIFSGISASAQPKKKQIRHHRYKKHIMKHPRQHKSNVAEIKYRHSKDNK